ncbi:hypothetical protein GOV09_01955 [Candidatus Woesearchaeota archaeon]|nr:hypothetical protein [Candidatus Woesearchaeota archaeon]
MDDIKKIYTDVISLSKKNPNISKDLILSWKKDEDIFYKKCIEIGKLQLKELSDKELIALHDEFTDIALNNNTSSSVIDGFALGTDELIADMIKEGYDASELKDKMRYTEVFSILTAPVHLSFINEAEVSLLKVALDPTEDSLKHHQKNYFWTRNNYVDSFVLTVDDFKKEIRKLHDMDIDIMKEIENIEQTPEINKKKKKELMDKLSLSQELKILITISEDFTYWQDERKRSTFWNAHYFLLLLKEISRRVTLPFEELKYVTPREIPNLFVNPPTVEELKERRKNSVYYWDKEGMECLYGKEADGIKQAVLGTQDLSDIDDFRGLTASLGKAVGKVKVLKSAKEVGKVEEGDILVAVMTRPDYVPGMKKAGAIVTDEGGVTCHAAIVSRELGKPCIIGTKIATKVLKDGQLVEVNANHGWVKIIR